MFASRPAISSTALTVAVAAYLLFVCNNTFWGRLSVQFAGRPADFALLGLVLLLLFTAFLLIFSAQYLTKPIFIAAILLAAGVSYFTDTFGTIVDRDMIQNVAETTQAESGWLITPAFLFHMLLFGIVPSLIVAAVRIRHKPFWRKVRVNTLVCLGLAAAAALILALNARTYVPFWQRQRADTMAYLNPAMPLVAAVDYAIHRARDSDIAVAPYGEDAHVAPAIAASGKKMLTVIVVGETARAQNFSLDGYGRNTNPELAARKALSFSNVTSCGTQTAISVPCMFSHLGRGGYSQHAALRSENLLDVLKHAGLSVEWWENNTGDKHVADRVPVSILNAGGDSALCHDGECLDQVLLDKLRQRLGRVQGSAVLVLHMMGSHGPAYYERYPESFARFQPDCRDAELVDCSQEQLVNAYDNTILYTDHILASVIDMLKAHGGDFASAMIYMSDHGESLGENGLYLHGTPYFLAPLAQGHIPFIAWVSDDFAAATGLDLSCLSGKATARLSHDNLFDTVLGLMRVQTRIYRPELDAFGSCRTSGVSQAVN